MSTTRRIVGSPLDDIREQAKHSPSDLVEQAKHYAQLRRDLIVGTVVELLSAQVRSGQHVHTKAIVDSAFEHVDDVLAQLKGRL